MLNFVMFADDTFICFCSGGHERISNSGEETDDVENGLMLIYYNYEDQTKFMLIATGKKILNKTEHKWNLN